MGDAVSRAGQWGKRAEPESGFTQVQVIPEASKQTQLTSTLPVLRSGGADVPDSMLTQLALEIGAQIFQWLDVSSRVALASCSVHLASTMRQCRRMQAGSLLHGGKLSEQASASWQASDRWLYQRVAKLAPEQGWQPAPAELRTFDAREREALEAVGREAGSRFMHVNGLRCYQPVINGIAKVPGWQSLSLCYLRMNARQGLTELAGALVPGDGGMRRELSLRIFGCEEAVVFRFPDDLRSQGLDLVELYLDQVIDPADLLPGFRNERTLQSLEILVESSVEDAAQVIEVIGKFFPDLRYFRLVSYQPFGISPHAWREFVIHHPKLEVLDINHLQLDRSEVPLDFQPLRLSEFILTDFHLADPDSRLATWIRDNRYLDSLEIELDESVILNANSDEAQVRNRLLQSIATNASLSALKLKGDAWMSFIDENDPCDSFLSLLDAIISHPTLKTLQIPMPGVRGLQDLLNGVPLLHERLLMDKLLALESLQPELRLTLGEFEMQPIQYKSLVLGSDQPTIQRLSGWSKLERLPRPGEALVLMVTMSVWGDGAFRRFIRFCALPADRQQRYLLDLARQGSLVEGSVRVIRIDPDESDKFDD